MALIDLDRFKELNDTYGHNVGDRILRELATEWKRAARHSDIIARVGGDEFIILMPNTDLAGARIFLSRLSAAPTHPWSWGMTEWRTGEIVSTAIARADEAMYRNKMARYRRDDAVWAGAHAAEEAPAYDDEAPIELPAGPEFAADAAGPNGLEPPSEDAAVQQAG